ncbi:MAG: hypothetical protein CMJ58_17750 [Planctomycetaceae bacterium]|nr:hypothetical protein [Planctomycetaceae bacterium]
MAAIVALTALRTAPAEEVAADASALSRPAFDAQKYEARQQTCRDRVVAAVRDCRDFLAQQTAAGDADTWREHLRWQSWAPAVLAEETWPAETMRAAVERLFLAKAGHEQPPVRELRAALVDYFDNQTAVSMAGSEAADWHAASVELLAAAAAGEEIPYADLEPAAWWLDATGQATELLQQVRSIYSGPVIVGQIHRGALEEHLEDFRRETEETHDTKHRIQDATVIGRATVKSVTQAELASGPDDVRLRVTATGTVDSPRNRSTSGRVRVFSSSHSDFSVTAELYFDGSRFVLTEPQATAETTSEVQQVRAPQLIRYAAEKRVRENQPEVEKEVEGVIAQEVAEGLRTQVGRAVAKFNEKTVRFLAFLLRTGNDCQQWQTRLTPGAVQIGYRPRLKGGLGAPPCELPPLVGDERIGLSLHDGAIEGILANQVAGSQWRDVDFSKMQRELTGGNTEEHFIGLYPERWQVQWSWRQPVSLRFTTDAATLTYRFDWIEIDGRRFETPLEVRMEMLVAATELGHQLRPLAPAFVDSQDGMSTVDDQVQQLLVRKFSRPTDEPFYMDGLQFPAGGELDGLAGYRACDAVLAPHWVHLKYTNRGHVASPQTDDARTAAR